MAKKREEEHEFGSIRDGKRWNGQEWVPESDFHDAPVAQDFPCPECGKPMDEKNPGCESHPL